MVSHKCILVSTITRNPNYCKTEERQYCRITFISTFMCSVAHSLIYSIDVLLRIQEWLTYMYTTLVDIVV